MPSGVPEVENRPEGDVDRAAVPDAEDVEPRRPAVERLRPVGDPECQVIQAGAMQGERRAVAGLVLHQVELQGRPPHGEDDGPAAPAALAQGDVDVEQPVPPAEGDRSRSVTDRATWCTPRT